MNEQRERAALNSEQARAIRNQNAENQRRFAEESREYTKAYNAAMKKQARYEQQQARYAQRRARYEQQLANYTTWWQANYGPRTAQVQSATTVVSPSTSETTVVVQ